MDQKLKGKKVAILATDGYEESELLEPKNALEDAGATVAVIAPGNTALIQGMEHNTIAGTVPVDIALASANPGEFDAVLLPGGVQNADKLRMVPEAQEFVKKIDSAGKPIAVICHGPWLLVSAGLVKGKTLTSYYTLQDDIRNAGGKWVDKEVVRDGTWVSSRKVQDIPAFNREMILLFGEK